MGVRRTVLVPLVGAASLAAVPASAGSSYLVRSITAVIAVWMLLRHGNAPGRLSRTLLAAAILTGVLSGLLALAWLGVTGRPSPPGGPADWAYLLYGPLTVAGLLALPRHPVSGAWRLRAATEAALVVTSLGFLFERLFAAMATRSHETLPAKVAALGYPANAIWVVAVVLTVLPRLQAELRPFLRTAGLGLTLLMVGDIGYSVGALHGWYTPTTWPAAATQSGLLLVAVSPLFARRPLTLVEDDPHAPTLLETGAPYLTLLPGIAWTCYLIGTGRTLTVGEMLLLVGVGVSVVARQLLSNVEHRQIIGRISAREAEARTAALQDPLTGLANRTAFHQTLAAYLREQPTTLALLDLDDFKDINDTQGHDTGDAVLAALAGRLRHAVPPGALVARLGGDEFAVCAPAADAALLSESLLAVFEDPVVLGTRLFHLTASIGLVPLEPGSATTAAALSHVDVAMYEAKSRKEPQRSGVVVLDGLARARAAERVQLRDDISRPRLEEFRVVYEPVVDLATGQVVGAEALLRWRHPVLGDVPPGTFIPLAEQVGSIQDLGELALRTAIADLAGWLLTAAEAGHALDEAVVGVNLSPRQLGTPGLVELVAGLLAEHRVAPRRLVLEITEEALLEDWDTAVEAVHALRALGVGVAVDDFGTGYSSMRYLRRFDASTVKVDREFVECVADEPRTQALVASVIDLARQLGLVTVAEGIETLDQLHVMRALGCRLAQGYLFDRPLEDDAFGALLVARHTYPLGAAEVPQPRSEARQLRSLG